jgi:hypothetical protein
VTEETTAPKTAEAVPAGKRRRRASTGGFALKLDAPKREGYVRRWVNGDPARIAELEDLGYTFVSEKAGEGAKRTDSQGTRISRHAGRLESGAPMQAFLMETPVEEYNVGLAEKEDRLKPFEDAIRRGDDPTGGLDKGEIYQPSRSTINHSG